MRPRRLSALLALQARAEERAAVDHASAAAAFAAAGANARRAWAAHEAVLGGTCPVPGAVLGSTELSSALRFGRRLERAAREASERAARLGELAERARAEHLAARRHREALEGLCRRETERRRRAREGAELEEVEDAAQARRFLAASAGTCRAPGA